MPISTSTMASQLKRFERLEDETKTFLRKMNCMNETNREINKTAMLLYIMNEHDTK